MVVTFALVSVLILAAGANPIEVFFEMLVKPLSKRTARLEVLVQATPLVLAGVAVAFAFVSGYYNIGAEGQLYAGALAAAFIGPQLAGVPAPVSIVLMIVLFGNWRPSRVLFGALLFGFLQALQLRLQAEGVALPYELLLALPYLVTILVLAVVGRSASYPAALLKPYRREGET